MVRVLFFPLSSELRTPSLQAHHEAQLGSPCGHQAQRCLLDLNPWTQATLVRVRWSRYHIYLLIPEISLTQKSTYVVNSICIRKKTLPILEMWTISNE